MAFLFPETFFGGLVSWSFCLIVGDIEEKKNHAQIKSIGKIRNILVNF